MDENQPDIFEEEEEIITQDDSQSDIFSLLKNFKQQQLIDEEAANQTELSPDAYALSEVIKQLLPLVNGSCELYSDLRQRFVEQKLKQNNFTFQSEVIADIEPNSSEIKIDNMDKLKVSLIRMAAHLHQVKIENQNAEIQHAEAVKQLQSENENLRNELSSMRQAQFVGSSSLSSPERASSSQVTFQSTIITPRTIRTTSSSSTTPSPKPGDASPLSPLSNNSSSLTPKYNNSSSLTPKHNNSSSLSPKPNNPSSVSARSNNSPTLYQRSNNSPSFSPRPNNSSSRSPKPNNSSSLSPRPNDVSTISQRPKNSSSFSARSNHSSSSSNPI